MFQIRFYSFLCRTPFRWHRISHLTLQMSSSHPKIPGHQIFEQFRCMSLAPPQLVLTGMQNFSAQLVLSIGTNCRISAAKETWEMMKFTGWGWRDFRVPPKSYFRKIEMSDDCTELVLQEKHSVKISAAMYISRNIQIYLTRVLNI